MKLMELKPGDTFSLGGVPVKYEGVEGESVILRDMRTKRMIIHGLTAAQRTLKLRGLVLVDEKGEML